jgi:DNA-binding NarL/FixJ family response regulator
MSARSRVLLADADTPTRMGVRMALIRHGLEIAAEAADADAAIRAAVAERPDVVLIAADLPGDGIDAARRITARAPGTKIVVLTGRPNGDELVAAVLAGAYGYLGKDMSQSRLPVAVDAVLAGETALPRPFMGHVLEALRGRDARRVKLSGRAGRFVSDRQWEVLNMLAEGRSTAEMAHRLGISEVTARRHISAVLSRLGLRDRASAAELLRDRSPD